MQNNKDYVTLNKDGKKLVHCAGIVIVDFNNFQRPKALCLMCYGRWGFPKGHIEAGENFLDAAKRETEEETGLSSSDYHLADFPEQNVTYKIRSGMKNVTYFFAERATDAVPFLPTNPEIGKPEHDAWSWISVDKLYDLLPASCENLIDKLVEWCDSVVL